VLPLECPLPLPFAPVVPLEVLVLAEAAEPVELAEVAALEPQAARISMEDVTTVFREVERVMRVSEYKDEYALLARPAHLSDPLDPSGEERRRPWPRTILSAPRKGKKAPRFVAGLQ
jgi:hypothetical protein